MAINKEFEKKIEEVRMRANERLRLIDEGMRRVKIIIDANSSR